MKKAALDLLSSKKFAALIVGAIVWAAGRWGFHADPAALEQWADGILVLIGAYGAQDVAKAIRK